MEKDRTKFFTAATFGMVAVGVVLVIATFILVLTMYYGGVDTHCSV